MLPPVIARHTSCDETSARRVRQ